MSHSKPTVFDWLEAVCWTLGLLLLVALNSYFGYKVHGTYVKFQNRSRPNPKKKKALWNGLAIFTASLLYTLCTLCYVLIHWVAPLRCQLLLRLATGFWQLARNIVYTVFILRVDGVYSDTSHCYKKRTINALLVFCWSLGGFLFVVSLTTLKGKDQTSGKVLGFCQSEVHFWHMALVLFLDASLSGCTLRMFTKPLKSITHQIQSEEFISKNGEEQIRKLHSLAIRYTVATWAAVLSTVVMILGYIATKSIFIAPIDFVINCVCLGLLTNWYPERFEQLCALPLWVFNVCLNTDEDNGSGRQRVKTLSVRGTVEVTVVAPH